ncbi:hypothetical protein ACWEPC_58245, partial [Nonomuraea sp. NPDC004297]
MAAPGKGSKEWSGGEQTGRAGGVPFGGDVEQRRRGGRQRGRPIGVDPPRGLGRDGRDVVDVGGQAGEDGGGVEGVQPEQADGRGSSPPWWAGPLLQTPSRHGRPPSC